MENIREKITTAYKLLLKNDSHLLRVNANERSITHKLAEHLQAEFSEYNVDCEYNRDGWDKKELGGSKKLISSDDTNAVSVFPDIIIHHRGTNNNFIVIEAKKSSNGDNDDEKLLKYKRYLGYKHAFAIKFLIGNRFIEHKDANLESLIEEK